MPALLEQVSSRLKKGTVEEEKVIFRLDLQGSCMFEYLPLKAGEQTGRLSFSSSELGVYQYDLNLTATLAGTEAPVHFRAGLGTSQSQTCRFVNFAKSKVEYSCKVNTSFTSTK